MSRIASTFAALRARKAVAVVPFFTVGDPDLATTRRVVLAAVRAGADVVELGVPFSDPMADGPVLQRAALRALAGGTSLPRVLELVADLRRETEVPLVLFGYYNPFLRYGLPRLATDAARAGADAFLCVDLPPEEDAELRAAASGANLDVIRLLAPTTPTARMRAIAQAASGFLYCVSVLGVTGGRDALPPELPALVARVRAVTDLPVGVGFGVQSAAQAAWIAEFADAVIVGSAIAKLIERGDGAEQRVEALVGELRGAVDAAAAAAAR